MQPDPLRRSRLHILLIAVLGFCIYSNTFGSPFVFDDVRYIADNPAIKDLQNFLEPSRVQALPLLPELKHAFRTRILGHLTFALNYQAHGLDVTGYHVFNFTVHIANALLVYWLVLLTFRTPYLAGQRERKDVFDISKHRYTLALFVAILFVSHPVQTQAITYITQRFASLATFFYLLSVTTFVNSRLTETRAARLGSYSLSVSSAALAMLTKEISFTLPAMIALYEVLFLDGPARTRAIRLVPLFLTMSIIPFSLIAASPPGTQIGEIQESMRKLAIAQDMSRWDYLITQFRVICTYLRLLVLPVDQNLYYDYPLYRTLLSPSILLSLSILLSIALSACYLLYCSVIAVSKYTHGFRLLAFGIFWFFIALSMESSIIPIKDVIFEHRLYLPSVGIFLAFSTGLLMILHRLTITSVRLERAALAILAAIALPLSATAYARNGVYQNEVRLWEDVVKKSPAVAYNHSELALAYDKFGRIEDAIREYRLAIELHPGFALAHNNLGLAFMKQGRVEDAIEQYRIALRTTPTYYQAHINLGVAYFTVGRIEDAVREYVTAIQIKPSIDVAHFNLGLAYRKKGYIEDAIRSYRIALQINPDFLEAHYELGDLYRAQARFDDALREFHAVLNLDSSHAAARRGAESIMRMSR